MEAKSVEEYPLDFNFICEKQCHVNPKGRWISTTMAVLNRILDVANERYYGWEPNLIKFNFLPQGHLKVWLIFSDWGSKALVWWLSEELTWSPALALIKPTRRLITRQRKRANLEWVEVAKWNSKLNMNDQAINEKRNGLTQQCRSSSEHGRGACASASGCPSDSCPPAHFGQCKSKAFWGCSSF